MATGNLKFKVWNAREKQYVTRAGALGWLDTPEIRIRLNGELVIQTEYGQQILDPTIYKLEMEKE